MKITQFFGDGEHVFDLTPAMITELERKAGIGIGALCTRVFRSDFHLADLTETIRLALIGGGKSPQEAHVLVSTYTTGRPISEFLPVALRILEHVYFGTSTETEDDDQDNEKEPAADE